MLSDQDLDDAIHKLAEYRKQDSLKEEILAQYDDLLKEHKRLKSDLEEERENREKYKQMARGQDKNPFVLVLVDGDGYVFAEDLIAHGAEGGGQAAARLHTTINASLNRKGLENCQVMVRIYANLAGLSKALSKVGLIGADKRSLSPFVASFNRSHGLMDFVDAGDLKENADFKLREMLRLYAEDPRCKHIYFAACHDVGYVSELVQHRGAMGKVTLIRALGASASGVHREFDKLGFPIEELRGVFRDEPLVHWNGAAPQSADPPSTPWGPSAANHHSTSKTYAAPFQSKVCSHFLSGTCKYGFKCHNSHSTTGHSRNNLSKSDQDFMTNQYNKPGMRSSSWRDTPDPDFSKLPTRDDIPSGHVAINSSDHRLDPYVGQPSADIMTRVRARVDKQRVCNNYHLNGLCELQTCDYDHNPLEAELKPALEFLARSNPCSRRGACRDALCNQGHVCQLPDCKQYGGSSRYYCKIPHRSHQVDLALGKVIMGVIREPGKRSTSGAGSGEDVELRSPVEDSDSAGAPLPVE